MPWKKDPVSFTLAFLFKKEKNKSPTWQLKETIIDKIIIKNEKLFVKMNVNKVIDKQVKMMDPIAPEKVLFGLIFINLGPFKILPTIYPPMSEATHPNKIIYRIIFK